MTVCGFLLAGASASGRDSEAQHQQQIQAEPNPIKKAKLEIKLSKLQLGDSKEAYKQGHIDTGAKLLDDFLRTIETTWKQLQDSGRQASRQPDGFRDLEIALREDVRALQDMQRTVSYFDRAPLGKAEERIEQIRAEVLRALFPGGGTRSRKHGATPPSDNPSSSPAVR